MNRCDLMRISFYIGGWRSQKIDDRFSMRSVSSGGDVDLGTERPDPFIIK